MLIKNYIKSLKKKLFSPLNTKKLKLNFSLCYLIEFNSEIEIKLRYFEGAPVIKELKRISKPGLRQYAGKEEMPEINGGLGMAIISTNKGLMTDQEAKEAGLGGEIICSIF